MDFSARPAAALMAILLCACASTQLHETGVLSSYRGLEPAKKPGTKALYKADLARLESAKTVRIAPVAVRGRISDKITPEQRALIANEVGRTLCARLGSGDQYTIVGPRAPADLTVRAVITGMTPTNKIAAGASMGVKVVTAIVGIPVSPRVPIGLGTFSAEAEAVDRHGHQDAAMVWTEGANDFLTGARVSTIGDAYQLSATFATNMARLMIDGKDPLRAIDLPPLDPKHPPAACEVYGDGERSGFVDSMFGIPPEAVDKGKPSEQPPHP
jgi:hypothetical protein